MRNEYILNSKIFLFAGAGASRPFDKWLMGEFIYHLINEIRGISSLHGVLETIIKYRGNDLEDILKEINDLTDKDAYLGDVTTTNYLQDILEAEDIKRRKDAAIISGSPPAIRIGTFPKRYSELNKICVALRHKIEVMVYDHYGFLDKGQIERVAEVYDPLINILMENIGKQNILPIFTTNYDICFEKYAEVRKFDLIDGIYPTPSGRELIWREENFNKFIPKNEKKYLILFKLHGSVTWYEDEGIIKYLDVAIHRGERERIRNVIIYPAKNKIALDNPFFTGYDYFQRCLDHARIGIFVGYSFRDYDTVTKIKSALKFNDALRILILDPNAPQIITTSFSDFQDRIIPLEFKFGLESDEQSYLKEISKHLQKT
jgi:hypothetical protein